jgi:hypothetical protein
MCGLGYKEMRQRGAGKNIIAHRIGSKHLDPESKKQNMGIVNK